MQTKLTILAIKNTVRIRKQNTTHLKLPFKSEGENKANAKLSVPAKMCYFICNTQGGNPENQKDKL